MEQIHAIINFLVDFVHDFGYLGIFIMCFLESTFLPVPSEVTMVPAGYLVQQGLMNFWIVFIVATLGCIGGAIANYLIAYHFGRRFLLAFGHYMFFKQDKMAKLDRYFDRHGEITTLTGRLIPGVRHVISFPAGLAHMDFKKFTYYTAVGGGLWMLTLIMVGYLIGDNKELVHEYMPYITGAVVAVVVVLVGVYIFRHRSRKITLTRKVGSDGVA